MDMLGWRAAPALLAGVVLVGLSVGGCGLSTTGPTVNPNANCNEENPPDTCEPPASDLIVPAEAGSL